MNLRETILENPRFGVTAASGLLIVGIVIIVFQFRGSGAPGALHDQQFFSVDDGKTWFTDSATNLPPYDKDGKQAVRAHVYRCADGTKFVNYLERFKPAAKAALESASAPDPDPNHKGPPSNLAVIQSAYTAGREVKRPGDKDWTDGSNFTQAAMVMAVKCPSGGADASVVDP
jgi:hypothetical protein